jgi:Mg/Co/Ni transporter MgtE
VTQTEREVDLQELSIHLQELESLIEAEQFVKASELLDSVDSSERTMVLARLPEAARQTLIKNTDLLHAASFLHDLPEAHAVETVGSLNPAKAALILDELPKSEQADLVGDGKPNRRRDSPADRVRRRRSRRHDDRAVRFRFRDGHA